MQKGIYLPLDAVLAVFASLFVLGTLWLCEYWVAGSRDFAKDRGKLVVLSSSLSMDNSKEKRVTLVGVVTNQSDHAWSRLEFDVRFYATNGALIDVFESTYDNFTLESHDNHAFSLTLYNHAVGKTYATHTVSVRSAREPGVW